MYKYNILKLAVIITCNDIYVPKAIVALKCFTKKNNDYDMYIIGTQFTMKSYILCKRYHIKLVPIDLSNDFPHIHKRPYGNQYPIECYYHFYAYKLLPNYNYIVKIEPDIYTNLKLDIDLTLVKYIAGSFDYNNKISNWNVLMKDLHKIKQIQKNPNINQYKILGGFCIYNVSNLHSIHFYETIVKYYKNSWIVNAPRCGDDSLMVLYQMFNKSHFLLVKPCYHVISSKESIENVKHIYMFHQGGNNIKYWIDKKNISDIGTYFKNKFIEFIYNHFDILFIKRHLPSIYIDINDCKIDFYYWNGVHNFGDLITLYYLQKFCNRNNYNVHFKNDNKPKIISCGSIMRLCNKHTIVYGSGIRNIDQNIEKGVIKFVRGPLTRKRLLNIGCYCPPEYGDPGLLLPLVYNPIIYKKYTLGIVPHYIQYKKVYNLYKNDDHILIINLINKNIEHVIDAILSCEKIISSSLHGLICADAYNIPNKWVQYDTNIKGDNTKYYDYFQSVKRQDQSFIDCFNYKKIPINELIKNIKPVDIEFNPNELKDNMFFNDNGITNYTKYLVQKISQKTMNNIQSKYLPNNYWYALKKHWTKYGNDLIASTNTFLKKKELSSKYLENKYKQFVITGSVYKLFKVPKNSLYYIVQLPNNFWYAFKKHWAKSGRYIICITDNTYLKKLEKHTNELDNKHKKHVTIGSKFKLFKIQLNDTYYIIQS